MIRELLVQDTGHPAPSYYTINAANAKTGMGVVITNAAALEVGYPGSAADENVYFLHKERIPTGINAAYTNLPDTFDEFVNIVNGSKVKMRHYEPGDVIATDQINTTNVNAIVNASYVKVGTDGKIDATANSGADASKMQFLGKEVIGGIDMYKILFLD